MFLMIPDQEEIQKMETLIAERKTGIGSRIKQLLQARNQTHADFATTLGVSRPTVTAWLNGANRIPVERITQIADHFAMGLQHH